MSSSAEATVAGPEPVVGLRAIGRRLWSIALPVLPVLAAEPIYLLVDGIVVGRQGPDDLAALGVGALVLLVLGTQMNFLSYGTTARSSPTGPRRVLRDCTAPAAVVTPSRRVSRPPGSPSPSVHWWWPSC